MLKFSVIIPAYNAEKFIAESLNSVLKQSISAYEIIVIDDGSTDNTSNIIKEISSPLIKYLYQQNGGPSKARNRGILQSTGDYIAFLDADDLWYPDHLSDASSFFDNNPSVLWFTSAFNILDKKKNLKASLINSKADIIDFFISMLRGTFIHTSAVIINRNVFTNVGLFNENWKFGEDLNLWVRIALEYPKIGYCANPGSIFRKTVGSLTFDKVNYDFKNTLRVLYFTDKEASAHNDKMGLKLISNWIEDALYSAMLSKNELGIAYIKKRWISRIGVITRLILLCYNFSPLIIIKAANFINKLLRKYI